MDVDPLAEAGQNWNRSHCSVRWISRIIGSDHRQRPQHPFLDHHSLWWCRRSQARLALIDGSTELETGMAGLLPPYATRTDMGPAGDWEMIGVGFSVDVPPEGVSPLRRLPLPVAWRPRQQSWPMLIDRLSELQVKRSIADHSEAGSLMHLLLWWAIIDLMGIHGGLAGAAPPWLAAVRDRLCRAIRPGDALLPELAAVAGISVNHLIRVFKEVHGCTPMAWNRRYRLDQAARLLIDQPEDELRAIAARVGYRNLCSFTRAFRAQHGMSPRRWRASKR